MWLAAYGHHFGLRESREMRLAVALLAAGAGLATAQVPVGSAGVGADSSGSITGRLVDQAGGSGIPFATVVVLETGRARFADDSGRFTIAGLAAGRYHLRGRQIGFAPVDTVTDVQARRATDPITFRLRRLLVRLPTVAVVGRRVTACVATGIPDSSADPELASVFAQLRENVDRFRLLLDEYPFRYRREEKRVLHQSGSQDRVLQDDTVTYESRTRAKYEAGHVLFFDRDVRGQRRLYMYLPTFRDLGDSAFQRLHCFDYMGEESARDHPADRVIRIDFRPTATLRTPDVEGSLYLDAERFVIRRATFRLTRSRDVRPPILGLDVSTTFREIESLLPVFDSTTATQALAPIYSADGPEHLVTRVITEDDQYLGHEFEYGAPGDASPRPP